MSVYRNISENFLLIHFLNSILRHLVAEVVSDIPTWAIGKTSKNANLSAAVHQRMENRKMSCTFSFLILYVQLHSDARHQCNPLSGSCGERHPAVNLPLPGEPTLYTAHVALGSPLFLLNFIRKDVLWPATYIVMVKKSYYSPTRRPSSVVICIFTRVGQSVCNDRVKIQQQSPTVAHLNEE